MMQEQMFTQRVKNWHCLSVASLAVFQLNLLVISEWSVWVVLWNFLHKKFPPSAQDKKTILPPQAVPLPLQGRLNVSLRDSTHLNYLSQNVTFSHLLFGRVSSGRNTFSLIRSTHYSSLTIHLFIPIWSFHFSLFTNKNRLRI